MRLSPAWHTDCFIDSERPFSPVLFSLSRRFPPIRLTLQRPVDPKPLEQG
jgi:hypothetical protein